MTIAADYRGGIFEARLLDSQPNDHPMRLEKHGFDKAFLGMMVQAEKDQGRNFQHGSTMQAFFNGRSTPEGLTRNTVREDLTFANNAVLYSKTVAGFVDQAFRPDLVGADVIRMLPIPSIAGISHLKVTTNQLMDAQELPDNAAITYQDDDYDGGEIEFKWYYSASKFTKQVFEQSAVDIAVDQLGLIGQALAQQMDTTIISALDTASPDTNANSNYEALGGSQDLDYSHLNHSIASHRETFPGVKADVILTNPTTYADFLDDAQVKAELAVPWPMPNGAINPDIINYAGRKWVVNEQVSANTTYLIDSKKLGYLVEGSPMETFDDRISGTLAWEIIGVKNWGVNIIRPGAMYRIMDNTA